MRGQGVIGEDLVDDERRVACLAAFRERRELGASQHRAGRVVRADGQHGADGVSPALVERLDIDRPSALILQPVRNRPHAVEPRQMIEERVTRDRKHDRIAVRRAEELEEYGVRVTGTGGEHDAFGSNVDAVSRVVARDSSPRVRKSERARFVP